MKVKVFRGTECGRTGSFQSFHSCHEISWRSALCNMVDSRVSFTFLDMSVKSSAGADPQNQYAKRWYWTPEELWAATGTSDCTQLRHSLHLRSAYSQIKVSIVRALLFCVHS